MTSNVSRRDVFLLKRALTEPRLFDEVQFHNKNLLSLTPFLKKGITSVEQLYRETKNRDAICDYMYALNYGDSHEKKLHPEQLAIDEGLIDFIAFIEIIIKKYIGEKK